MKKVLRIAACLLAVSCLFACTLPAGGGDDMFSNNDPDNVSTDPIKVTSTDTTTVTDNTTTGDDKGDVTDTNTTDNNEGNIEPETGVPPYWYEFDYTNTENASVIGHITAYDTDDNILWEYYTGEIMVGQYDNLQEIGERDNGYYFVADGVLFCLSKYSGRVLWLYDKHNGVGASCSYAFDEDGTIYIGGYEGPRLAVIDKDGKELYYYTHDTLIADSNELDDYYWLYDLKLEDDKVVEYYYSTTRCLIIDPKTGEAYPEEFAEDADWSSLIREWEFTNWQSNDGSTSYEAGGSFKVEFIGDNTEHDLCMSLTYISEGGNEVEFSYMPVSFRAEDLYEGVSDYFYGVWCGECAPYGDEDNFFAFQMTDPDTLEVIWFQNQPDGYTIISFMDKEILQYYQDVLALRQQENN